MNIPDALSIENRLAAMEAASQSERGELGRDAFLELLVSQLANQDPLSPLKDHEFIAQLATFSSLEQLEGINRGMQTSILMNQAVNNTLATNLIGKEILAVGDTISVGEDGASSFTLELDQDADVSILIRDSEGELVRRIDRGRTVAGSTDIQWDGLTDAGTQAESGEYQIEIIATNEAGLPVVASARVRALVEGVTFIDGAGYLMIGGATIPLANVIEVLAPQS